MINNIMRPIPIVNLDHRPIESHRHTSVATTDNPMYPALLYFFRSREVFGEFYFLLKKWALPPNP
jgi:hypothetical protein